VPEGGLEASRTEVSEALLPDFKQNQWDTQTSVVKDKSAGAWHSLLRA
jgi:hypothetical protein